MRVEVLDVVVEGVGVVVVGQGFGVLNVVAVENPLPFRLVED